MGGVGIEQGGRRPFIGARKEKIGAIMRRNGEIAGFRRDGRERGLGEEERKGERGVSVAAWVPGVRERKENVSRHLWLVSGVGVSASWARATVRCGGG